MRAALPDAIFAGFLHGEALARAYASSDVFVFPSESETFGNVTLEAMASGVPAVCANASGSRSLVAEGETGFLVSAANEYGFIDRIATLAARRELRLLMAAAALERALHYRWDNVMSGLLSNYVDVIEETETVVVSRGARHPVPMQLSGTAAAD
jgi:phosphatidylinositol alpha 1,6-mannosyltransferase